jgi:DNA primase
MSDPVLTLLQSKGLYFTVSGKDYLIKCLNPEHDDSNPSFRVDKVTGISHCFSCGFKCNLFKFYGIFTNNSSIRVAKLKEKLKDLSTAMLDTKMPDGHTPYTRTFRGISTSTLRHFGAFYTHEVEKLEDRVIFPIYDVTSKLVACVARHALSDGNPRYVVYPSGKSLPLYPTTFEEPQRTIVLVEGIFDMLNMYDKGARNVVCCFGTSTLRNDVKNKLLPYKAQGIEKIFILFDGDKAGREAAQELKPILETENFIVEIIDLPDDQDPGDLSQEDVTSIKEYTK